MIPIIPIVVLSIASSVLYVNYSYDKMVYGSLKNKREFLKGSTTTDKKSIKKTTFKEDNKEAIKEETKLEKVEGEIVEKDKEDIIKEYENSAPIKKKDIGPNSPFTIIPEEETHAPKFDTLKEEGKKISELDNIVELNSIVEEKPAADKTDKKEDTKEESTTEKKSTKKTITKKSEKAVEEKPAKKPITKKTTTKAESTTEKKSTKKTTSKKSEKVDKKESEDK